MKSIRYIQSTLMALMVLAATSCADDILPLGGGDEMVVTFRPTISNTMTRAIGVGSKIDELVVGVYSGENLIFTQEMQWNKAQSDGVNLTLIEGRTYNILFWAQCSDNSAYVVTNDGITVDYDDYLNGGFAKMEELDAFCATATVTVGSQKIEDKGPISLSRPLAQVNFADDTTSPTQGSHKAVVTFTKVPTAFNPFTGTVTMSDASCTFTFTDFPTEPLMVDGTKYHYVTDNYFFAPAPIGAKLDLQNADGTSIKTVEVSDITLEKNKKTNVLGSIVQQPETWSVWDGTSKTMPELDDSNSKYIIDEASDIAWLAENGATLKASSTFLQTKYIDMNDKAIASIKLPAGSTYDGGGNTIKKFANSLFGDATSIIVKDLTLEEITASATSHASSHVGVLVNTLKGSSEFTNVSIANSSATTTTSGGAAGGMIGYIVRKSEKDRTETLSVSFIGCKLNGVSVSGSASEGKFVGLLSGYDNNESLLFDTACEATDVTVTDYDSMYAEGNEATWLANKDYTNFNGWLGNETYHRGTIYYGASNRFVPCWDGSTTITPLTDGSVKLIYSAFDLANLQGTNPGSIKFMNDVDLGLKVFNPLTNLTKLSGEDKTIYRLKVETTFNTNSWDGGGFVRRCSAATIENITFKDADVKVTHVSGSDGDAYASIVCGTAEGTNTMTNVKVIGGKLYGCNKMGGIAGYITGTFTATNCIVDGLSIQNYDSGGKDKLGFKANGEVGGAFGFIAANSTITGCYVKNTTLNCVGVNNGRVLVVFKYAGRHVNEFIGDIRTTSGQTIRITLDEKNFTGNSYKNRKDQYSGCKYIGHCYYTSINAVIAKIEDTKGTVYVNGNSITVAKNY